MKAELKGCYGSPRWSQEICDCSMPMTLDTYSACSFRCLYCFSFYQKSAGVSVRKYIGNRISSVNPDRIRKLFLGETPESQFHPFVQRRLAVQWGGLADQFDEYERQFGVSLELLRFFREIRYPISMSTKAVWWSEDERYVECFRGADHLNLKVSIITLDEEVAKKVEAVCPSPKERLGLIERAAKWGIGGVTLRLRPFIIGITSKNYLDLIREAHARGAEAVSTEFLCLEARARLALARYEVMGRFAGYPLLPFYQKYSPGQAGYLRLSREVKRPFMESMKELCDKLGMRFYVSDAHFKELSHNGACCGLRDGWNFSKGQFTQALCIARESGVVHWSDISDGLEYADAFLWRQADGYNTGTAEKRAQFHNWTMRDYIRSCWNDVRSKKSPARYFGGVLTPAGKDENGDVIYRWA